jgi:mannose-1-phosphate guanylyltransferase
MTPERAESDLGWIEPGTGSAAVRAVARFREKPPAAEAAALWSRGALVNSFLFVARARRLLGLFGAHLPDLLAAMVEMARAERPPVAASYGRLPAADFSRHVLERAVDALEVIAVPPCGWSDLGTPERVARCLSGRRKMPEPIRRSVAPGVLCVLADRLAEARI